MAAAEAGIDPNAVAPFDLATVTMSSIGRSCILWPQSPTDAADRTPPTLPDARCSCSRGTRTCARPTRTPWRPPRASRGPATVQVPGNGHDELGGDITGCAREALNALSRGRAVGDPAPG
jgi:hypothetical protein